MTDNKADNQEIVEVSTEEIVEPGYESDDDMDIIYDYGNDKVKLLGAGVAGGGIGIGLTILAIRFKKWRDRKALERVEKIKEKQNDSEEEITEDKE